MRTINLFLFFLQKESNDRASIKNVGAFFMGILQNFKLVNIPITGAPDRPTSWIDPPGMPMSLNPPPPILPRDLLFGYGDDEYVPEMPRHYSRPRVMIIG